MVLNPGYLIDENESKNAEEECQSDGDQQSKGQDWPVDLMKKSWNDDQGHEFDRNTSDFRQLRSVKTSLKAWLSENGGLLNPKIWNNMEKVTADGKVRKRIVYPGTVTAPIVEGMFVAWQYTGFVEPYFDKIIDATRFSSRREVFRVDKVDDGDKIQRGLRLGVSTMHLGETAHFRIHADYAFGPRGVPPRIPPNAVLHYVIEIRDEEVDDRKASNKFLRQQVDVLDDLGLELCLKAAYEFRERGITMFQKKAFESAKENFDDGTRAVGVCERLVESSENVDVVGEVNDLGNVLKLNLAVTNAKLSNWTLVAELTSSLVEKRQDNAKALYYLALAYFHLKKYEEGLALAARGIKLRRACPEFAELFSKLAKQDSSDKEKEKMFCRRMFAVAPPLSKENKWALVAADVKKHVAEGITKLQNDRGFVEIPMNYVFFMDKINLSYLEDQAKQAGFHVTIRTGKVRNIVRLIREN